LWLQRDGNLVLYKRGQAEALRASHTGGAVRLVNQADGNVVLYTADGRAAWDTETWRAGAPHARVAERRKSRAVPQLRQPAGLARQHLATRLLSGPVGAASL
jgi:hypothetical protein